MSADQPSDIVSRRPLSAREIALQLRSRWWLLLGLFALFASGAIVAASRYQPKYAATSSVTLRRPLEKRSIRSVHVEMRDLDQTPTGLADTLRQALLEPQALAAFFDANPLTFPAAEKERVRLTKLLERSMKFRPVSSVLFVIAVTAPSPDQSRMLAQWFAERAVRTYISRLKRQSAALFVFAQQEAERATQRLATREQALVEFLRTHPELVARGAKALALQAGSSTPDRLRLATAQRLFSTASQKLASSGNRLGTLLEERRRLRRRMRESNVNPDAGSELLQHIDRAERRVAALRSQGLSAKHPTMVAAKRIATELRQRLRGAVPSRESAAVTTLRRQLRKVTAELRSLRKSLPSPSHTRQLEARWAQLGRDYRLLRRRVDDVNRLLAMAAYNAKLTDYDAQTIAAVQHAARTPQRPEGLTPTVVLAISIIASLGLALMVVIVFAQIDRTVRFAEDVPALLHCRLVCRLPWQQRAYPLNEQVHQTLIGWSHSQAIHTASLDQGASSGAGRSATVSVHSVALGPPRQPGLFVATVDPSAIGDDLRGAASRLFPRSAASGVVMVTSWERRARKTTLVANLALALAERRRRLLLIDAGNGDLTQLFGVEPAPGTTLFDQLRAPNSSDWTVYRLSESLFLLAARPGEPSQAARFQSPVFANLLAGLRQALPTVLLDTPALADAPDAAILAAHTDQVILAARERRTSLPNVQRAISALAPTPLAGVVLGG